MRYWKLPRLDENGEWFTIWVQAESYQDAVMQIERGDWSNAIRFK